MAGKYLLRAGPKAVSGLLFLTKCLKKNKHILKNTCQGSTTLPFLFEPFPDVLPAKNKKSLTSLRFLLVAFEHAYFHSCHHINLSPDQDARAIPSSTANEVLDQKATKASSGMAGSKSA